VKNLKTYKTYFYLALILLSCAKPEKKAPVLLNPSINSFNFYVSQNPNLFQDISAEINGDSIIATVLSGTNLSTLKASFTFIGESITVNNQTQLSGITVKDFSKITNYTITSKAGLQKKYYIKFKDTGLPTCYLSTANIPINSKTSYVKGYLNIKHTLKGDSLFGGEIEIRGRGNSTWNFPKKPYKIKLSKKANLLAMGDDKDWILLANYADKSLIRNILGLDLSQNIGLAYTPASRFVEVVLNNQYLGNYQLIEQVEVGKNKVNIKEQTIISNNQTDIKGGYLFEVDGFAEQEKVNFITARRMPISIHYPDDSEITIDQKKYIRNHIEKFEEALFSSDFKDPTKGYQKYFDIDSYINFYLINEIIGNPDLFWSTKMYKKHDSELIFSGPVWDFDIAANNDNRLGDFEKKLMLDAAHQPKAWINQLMKDPTFRAKTRKRWNEIKAEKLKNTIPFIDQITAKLEPSQKMNFNLWTILSNKVYLNYQAAGSYKGEVDFLKTFMQNRIQWLDSQFNGSRFD
jgi:CotH kinase protein